MSSAFNPGYVCVGPLRQLHQHLESGQFLRGTSAELTSIIKSNKTIYMKSKLSRFLSGRLKTDKEIILQAQILARANRQLSSIQDFADIEFSAFSQWGEDGIIDWLISKIPAMPKSFIEFGVENYRESNTRLLLQLRNWRGLVIDGSSNNIQCIQEQEVSWRHQLDSFSEFITSENINYLISRSRMAGDIGLLSIDIDGNDYWVWRAITQVNPVVVVVEYNAVLGDLFPISIPYEPSFNRTLAHYSNLYFGASLPALIHLGINKGYTFVGSNTAGCNAFFVRSDVAKHILPSMKTVTAYPSLFRESRAVNGRLTFRSGIERSELIADCALVNVVTGEDVTLANLENIYGSEWLNSRRKEIII